MKLILLLIIIALTSFDSKSQENMKIVYVYDALCGWCYGFSPVMVQFYEKYKDKVDFEVISGGMITGDRIGPIGEVASYIRWAYKDVENATGIKFGSQFLNQTLENGEAIFTSIPPAIALSVFKETKPEQSIPFASELQKAIYYDGIEPENLEAYGEIAEKFGLNAKSFVTKMKDPFYKNKALEDFEKSAKLNVSGFPTLFIKMDGTYRKIGSGYMPLSKLYRNYLLLLGQD